MTDQCWGGADQSASLVENGIRSLSEVSSKAPNFLGIGKKTFISEEKKLLKKFKYW